MQITGFPDGTLMFVASDVADTTPRWKATITYQTISGSFSVSKIFDEIEDLHDIVEEGPDFYSIIDIKIEPFQRFATPLEETIN